MDFSFYFLDIFCGWCKREVPDNSPKFLTTPDGPRYCSESCFTQSRRASFKKAKTCDWCRHLRHAVSYVDFQDGASQLQFCSDRCLNQYKMQIFCKETQAHLDMNPHLKDTGLSNNSGLITPDLWLKNCRSRSISPESDISRSRSPTPPKSPSVTSSIQPTSHKPTISVAPVSKLMSKNSNIVSTRHLVRHTRKRKESKNFSNKNTENENNVAVLNLVNSVKDTNPQVFKNKLKNNPNPSLNNFPNFNIPPTIPFSVLPSQKSEVNPSNDKNTHHTKFAFSSLPSHQSRFPPLLSSTPSSSIPNVLKQPLHQTFLGAPIPPVTVMVPYPILLPLPIPIPIPLPLISFMKLAKENNKAENNSESNRPFPSPKTVSDLNFNEPLDFTKSKSMSNIEHLKNEKSRESNCNESSSDESEDECHNDTSKYNHPKIKITRLHAKRLIAKESEKSRPLRKRKRIIDYLRSSKEENDISQYKK